MKQRKRIFIPSLVLLLLGSCNAIEKASIHGFESDFYKMTADSTGTQKVYVHVTEDQVEVHPIKNQQPERTTISTLSLLPSDTAEIAPVSFSKNSLDLDLTSIPLKFRPAVNGMPSQLEADFNVAFYAGWRHDTYIVKSKTDPLGIHRTKVLNRGFDFGVFAGPGATPVNPSTTQGLTGNDYSGLIIQTGVAGFLESSIASFGIAVGLDHLMNADRDIWIYTNKPWIGFIVGIALN